MHVSYLLLFLISLFELLNSSITVLFTAQKLPISQNQQEQVSCFKNMFRPPSRGEDYTILQRRHAHPLIRQHLQRWQRHRHRQSRSDRHLPRLPYKCHLHLRLSCIHLELPWSRRSWLRLRNHAHQIQTPPPFIPDAPPPLLLHRPPPNCL